MRKAVLVILLFLLSIFVTANEEVPPSAPPTLDQGFTLEDYNTNKVNELDVDQLDAAISDGRITNFDNINDDKLQEVIVVNNDLLNNPGVKENVNTRIENDVSFVNNNEEFATAWFQSYKTTCTACKISSFDSDTGIVNTINSEKLTRRRKAEDMTSVMAFRLEDFPNVEIQKDGCIKDAGGSTICSARMSLDEYLPEEVVNIQRFEGGPHADFRLGDKGSAQTYSLRGAGRIYLNDDVSLVGENIDIQLDKKGYYTIESGTPTEFRYERNGRRARRATSTKIIPYVFHGKLSFHKDDLEISKEKGILTGLTLRHTSLGANTKRYDFNTGNVIDVEKPTEYYQTPEAISKKDFGERKCRSGSNCIEYYHALAEMGGVMHVEATDNNKININVVNLETTSRKYKNFQEKQRKEIDIELAYLSVGVIEDGSEVTVNDNGKVRFEFSDSAPIVKGKLMDKTITNIEGAYIEPATFDERAELHWVTIDLNGQVDGCDLNGCARGNVVSEGPLELTPAEISEHVNVAAYRYVLCSEAAGKCAADWEAFGFRTKGEGTIQQYFESHRIRWGASCIWLTQASLPPELQPGAKVQDRGLYVQDYLRRQNEGFSSMYFVPKRNLNWIDEEGEERVGEGRVLELVQRRMRDGENVRIFVFSQQDDKNEVLSRVSRGSFVTEPVDGHDYVFAGIDPLTKKPTTFEAHVDREFGPQISRDKDGISKGDSFLITYADNEQIYTKAKQKGTLIEYDPVTKEFKVEGVDAKNIKKQMARLIFKSRQAYPAYREALAREEAEDDEEAEG